MQSQQKEISDSYWVLPGRFMAGEYPCSLDESEARAKIRWLLAQGVDYFLDLTFPGESGLKPYDGFLLEEAHAIGRKVTHRRMPIKDMGVPTVEELKAKLDALDHALQAGHTVYLHCYGGIGRTGLVVGSYLVRHGMDGKAAIARIAQLREGTPDGWKRSPETDAQRKMLLDWLNNEIRS